MEEEEEGAGALAVRAAAVAEELGFGLDLVERVVGIGVVVDGVTAPIMLDVDALLTGIAVDVVTGTGVVLELGLAAVELLTEAAEDEAAAPAEVLAVFTVDRKTCAVAMNDAALTVTALPPTTNVAAGLRA